VLGQLFLVACVLALLSIAGILFIVLGPVPVKRRVTVVPRLAVSAPVAAQPMPSLVAQLAPSREQSFTPSFPSTIQGAPPVVAARPTPSHSPAPTPPPLPIASTPPPTPRRGAKVQPRQKQRVARGTGSPFAPVVRSAARVHREEDAVTNQVVLFDAEEMTIDESR
jgi:hypothetical protein